MKTNGKWRNHAPVTNGQEAKQSIQEMTLSKLPTLAGISPHINIPHHPQCLLSGVKNMFTNTVWGVPYAKVTQTSLFSN